MDAAGGDTQDLDGLTERSPNAALWIVYLFFAPRTFFRHFAGEPNPGLTAVCAWLFGMAGTIDRLEKTTIRKGETAFGDDWMIWWVAVALFGIAAGAFFYAVGGWWYRVRLGWSGAAKADPRLARRVYLFASQIIAVPTVAVSLIETAMYDTPSIAAVSEGSAWWLIILIFPFWSFAVS